MIIQKYYFYTHFLYACNSSSGGSFGPSKGPKCCDTTNSNDNESTSPNLRSSLSSYLVESLHII